MKWLLFLACSCLPLAAQVKVVSLHPLLTDLIQQVGGAQVEVIDLIGKTGDPHHFEPTAEQLRSTRGASLYFISGKGLESYLPALRSVVGSSAKIIDVGAAVPSIEGSCSHCEEHDHDHDHAEHSIDPHWWHSIDHFRRATQAVAKSLAAAHPEHAEQWQKNATRYASQLEELERWARQQIARIPKNQRHLATAHDAFGYFCQDYQFTAYPVQGLNREQIPHAAELAKLLKTLKEQKVRAIFPEKESNPKILASLTRDTGISLADALIADGTNVDSYEEMVRHNIIAIVKALAPAK
jgi:zinc/manganese transport system substrate-binding protein